jgi:hypothetical protein
MSEDKPQDNISKKNNEKSISDYLTEGERRKLVASLHHVLVWVGVKEPEECRIDRDTLRKDMDKLHQTEKDLPIEVHADKCTVDLHRLIWRLINEKEITDEERVQIEEMIDLLEKKERQEEDVLLHEKLTHAEAQQIFNEAAGVMRSIIDLKDLLKKREHELVDKTAKEKAKEIRDFADRYMESVTKV